MKTILLVLALGVTSSRAFFFPSLGGAGAGCNCQQAACAPAPACPVAAPPVCPPPPSCGVGCNGGNCGESAPAYPSSGCSGSSCGAPAPVVSGCAGSGVGCGATYSAPAPFVPQPQYQPLPAFQPQQQQVYYPQQQAQPAPVQAQSYVTAPQPQRVYQQQPQVAQPLAAQSAPQQVYQQQAPPQPVVPQQQSVEASPLRSEGYSSTGSGEQYVQSPAETNHAVAGEKLQEVHEEADSATVIADSDVDQNETVSHELSEAIPLSELKLTEDPLCNNEDLRKLMLENIDENLNTSKRLIQVAAETAFGGRFDVICANGDFSYITNTELFCQETKGDVSCYTYRQI